jgi:RNA polymerase sigma factor (sigma-70 family)
MDGLTDQQLLREYADKKSEAAFAQLVRRYVDLVYSVALRLVPDSHAAKDVTQDVFVALARNARQLASHPVLAGWLHQTTRNIAANIVRASTRRAAREQEAATMNEILDSEAGWKQIAPQLDNALSELSQDDREALLLRYFQRKSAQEMADVLGVTSEAAQKRVNRAVERLRELFAKRGIAVGAGGLAVVLSANAVHAAPAGLSATISTAAAGTSFAAATTTKIIAMTTTQKVFAAVIVAAALGAGMFEAHQASMSQEQLRQLEEQRAADAKKWDQEREATKATLAALTAENARLKSGQNLGELLKLRSEVGKLRQQRAAAGEANDSSNSLAKYLNDPTSRELTRVQIERKLRPPCVTLAHQLNLSPDATEKFINLLVNSEMNKKDMLAQAVTESWDGQTALRNRDEEEASLHSQLTSLLGESGYAQYDQFRRDSDAQDLVKALNNELSDNALNDTQMKQLAGLYAAKPQPELDNMDLFRSPDSLNATFQALVDRGDSDLQKAASFLSPQQLAAYGAAQSNYFSSLRTQVSLARQLVNSGGVK